MRFIKPTIIFFILLFCLLTAISLFIPANIRLSKAINLKASNDSVLALIKDTTRWSQWHPAFMQQRPNGVHIIPITSNDSAVVVQLQQGQSRTIVSGWRIYQFAAADSSTLQWYMDFHLAWYPWQKFSSLFYENIYGTMMEQGLGNIKRIADK